MEAWSSLLNGFVAAITPYNLLFALIGSIAGTLVGVLPGLGPTAAIAMLLPLTTHLEPAPAIIMMAAIYYGAMYGGSTTSILVNIPGEASSVPTAMEGYQLNLQGRGGPALGISAIASFAAGTMGVIGLTFFAPVLSGAALAFGPPEYFALTFLGLSLVVSLSGRDLGKGMLSALLGLLTAMIGLDPLMGVARLTFGSMELMAGIDFVPIIMGLFAISEILTNAEKEIKRILEAKRVEWLPTWQDIKDTWKATTRSGVIGFLAGLIPGCSPAVTSFMVYDLEKRLSKHPERFGKGAMDAVAAVEGSNNATASGGFVPLLAFGIPSGPALAVLLGGFLMYGLQPGPRLMQEQPALLWTIIASMYIGNVMLLVLNLPLVGLWARMALVPFPILGPMIAVFTLIGAYSLRHSFFDLWICILFGVVGYVMRKFDFPIAPMVLATVLAKLMETSFMQSLVMSKGSPLIFFTRPICIAFIALTVISVVSGILLRRKAKSQELELEESEA
ncbi:MAG: transporter [Deltaproteobacteria bacterium HGW-Deltaproteobacteria-15]|jgi:putative tricarboxylic transport membrane protein|nr:MAG: transporter [Deltaproteobacteria bacterium HGW-Deltaproteobacteria-15]